jgi:hypothetical protein
MKPCPRISAAKLDTQNGIRNSRNTDQRPSFTGTAPARAVLR